MRAPRMVLLAATIAVAIPASAPAAPTKVFDPVDVHPDATPTYQYDPAIGMASDGTIVVVYDESPGGGDEVYAQRFTRDLAPIGSRVQVGAGARAYLPSVAVAPDGRFVVGWQSESDPNPHAVVQRFTAAGATAGAPIVVDPGKRSQTSEPPALAMAADGGFAVAWRATDDDLQLRFRAYAADGTARTASPVDVAPTSGTAASWPSVAARPGGGWSLTWAQGTVVSGPLQVPLQRFTSAGAADGAKKTVFTGPMNQNFLHPALGESANGTGIVLFAGNLNGDYEPDIFGVRLDGSDAGVGDKLTVNDYTTYTQANAQVAMTSAGDALVAYEGQVGTQQVSYLRRIKPDGTFDGLGQTVATTAQGEVQKPVLATDDKGRIAYAFIGRGPTTSNVYLARWDYLDTGTPPPTTTTDTTPTQTTPAQTTTTQTQTQTTPPPPPPSATATPTPSPVTPASQPPAPLPSVAKVVTFPSAKRCASRRSFAIRLRVPKDASVASATVLVDGKQVAVRKGARLRSTVDLRALPKGRFTVKITLKLADGRTVSGSRAYRTCTVKRKSKGKPKV